MTRPEPLADVIRLDLPATHKYLNVLEACLTGMLARIPALDEPSVLTYGVKLAVHEICTNIVDYAYAGQSVGRINITLTMTPESRRLVVELHDTGLPFDAAAVPEPNLEEGQVHGYGLFLVRQLMDEVTYDPQPDGNRWRLVKNL